MAHSAVVGEPASVVCGTALVSNPQPTILWLDTAGDPIPNGGRYTFVNGSSEVRLDISFTRPEDIGEWTCLVVVRDNNVLTESNGELVPMDDQEIGRMTNRVTLIVVGKCILKH